MMSVDDINLTSRFISTLEGKIECTRPSNEEFITSFLNEYIEITKHEYKCLTSIFEFSWCLSIMEKSLRNTLDFYEKRRKSSYSKRSKPLKQQFATQSYPMMMSGTIEKELKLECFDFCSIWFLDCMPF